ncbi:MAG: hypothetical protein R6V18_05425 [Desulfuromonadaceae bacterium]
MNSTGGFNQEHVALLKRALTCDPAELHNLLRSAENEVVRAALKNVALEPEHLQSLLQRRDLDGALLTHICKHKLSHTRSVVNHLLAHPHINPQQIKIVLERLHLLELLNIAILPGQAADVKIAAEHQLCRRLPTAPLGNKITLARRATYPILEALMREGHPQVIEPCLNNPRMKEAAIYRYLHGQNVGAESINKIARHPRWNKRPNIRQAILRNRHTSKALFAQFLPGIPPQQARQLLFSKHLKPAQKEWIREILGKKSL